MKNSGKEDSFISAADVRIGNYLLRDNVMVNIDARSIFDIWQYTKEYRPLLLSENIMLRFRRRVGDNFQPLEFSKHPPGERQVENQFWSSWINEDYRLHLCPSYGHEWVADKPVKTAFCEFWFCWYCEGNQFLSLKQIRGHNRLRYVHQLQNLFYGLTSFDLVLEKDHEQNREKVNG